MEALKDLVTKDKVTVDDFIAWVKRLLVLPHTDAQLEAFKKQVRERSEEMGAVECRFFYSVGGNPVYQDGETLVAELRGEDSFDKTMILAGFSAEDPAMCVVVYKVQFRDWVVSEAKLVGGGS